MTNEELKEKYFNLKGKFLEIKELLEKSEYDSIGLAVIVDESLGIIRFDNFKMSLNEKLREISLNLYLNSQEVGYLNTYESFDFKFDFDELCIDFEGKRGNLL